jgi:hypothetical protein
LYYNIFIIPCKAYYAIVTVNVPEAVNLAILSPPGCVDAVNAQQGLPENARALGPRRTTIPEPPLPPVLLLEAPPPPPVFAVPFCPAVPPG